MEYQEGDIFTVESTWYGGVNVTSKTGVPLSLDEVEYEILGEESQSCKSEGRVVLHGNSREGVCRALHYAKQLLFPENGQPLNVEVEILADQEGVTALLTGKENSSDIQMLYQKGVKILVCQTSMRELAIGEEELDANVQIVPSGVQELVKKQFQGYGYIKA